MRMSASESLTMRMSAAIIKMMNCMKSMANVTHPEDESPRFTYFIIRKANNKKLKFCHTDGVKGISSTDIVIRASSRAIVIGPIAEPIPYGNHRDSIRTLAIWRMRMQIA